MPRNYVRKRPARCNKNDLDHAIASRIKAGESCYAVSKNTKIPYETLRRNCVYKMQAVGSPKVLNDYEEEIIVETMVQLSSKGFPMDRKDLKLLVKTYLEN